MMPALAGGAIGNHFRGGRKENPAGLRIGVVFLEYRRRIWMVAASVESTEEIKRRIGELNLEHRDLDRAIEALELNPLHDELQLKRLKKRKLMLKDQIFMLQRQLVPDIPA